NMDQARSTISKIFNGEPRSYTRFNLTQNMEGENSHVEMKLSSDVDEDPKNVCFMVIATLLIFVIGYLIGYLAHHKQDKDAAICAPAFAGSDDNEEPVQEEFEPTLDWEDLKTLLKNKLIPDRFEASFRSVHLRLHYFIYHEAGTAADEKMASLVYSSFKDYRMNPWHDEHYVKLQSLSPSSPNTIKFNGEVIGTPRGYAAYSATGTAEGRLLYAHYGMDSDFRSLQDRGIDLTGSVVLVRAGKLSFAEKVANAAKQNVVAVLIYPDPANYALRGDTELYGHVHLGSGDPYTPGFPSFNHTQFPPAQSSGLPSILAQTISANTAAKLFDKMSGQNAPSTWEEGGLQGVIYKLGDINDNVTVEVNNVLMEKKITNVFGVIKGFVDPDRYVVIGAQRDSWGPGFAKATVGTTLLMELACALSEMVKNDGFKPRRSIIFASWSAGEYGSVGTTEWLEGYLTSLNLKAFSYISLDGTIRGDQKFLVSSSPLLYSLVISTMKEVNATYLTDDASYPFLAFSGIPSISFCFAGNRVSCMSHYIMSTRTTQFAMAAAQVAGHMALRLVHDHLLRLDVSKYNSKIRSYVSQINRLVSQQWLMSAYGSFSRASSDLLDNIQNSDLTDVEMCRNINDRIMRVEHNLLSPYVSPKDIPFRHIIFGSGSHTLSDLVDHLNAMRNNMPNASVDRFRNQFALATWTIQGCSNALSGEIWEKDNQI
uniref:Transferrin receptor protein 1 n=1 Tax=Scleropages formosus TaxID=113540 RepID=A0A8C9WHP9_SCLFO